MPQSKMDRNKIMVNATAGCGKEELVVKIVQHQLNPMDLNTE